VIGTTLYCHIYHTLRAMCMKIPYPKPIQCLIHYTHLTHSFNHNMPLSVRYLFFSFVYIQYIDPTTQTYGQTSFHRHTAECCRLQQVKTHHCGWLRQLIPFSHYGDYHAEPEADSPPLTTVAGNETAQQYVSFTA